MILGAQELTCFRRVRVWEDTRCFRAGLLCQYTVTRDSNIVTRTVVKVPSGLTALPLLNSKDPSRADWLRFRSIIVLINLRPSSHVNKK